MVLTCQGTRVWTSYTPVVGFYGITVDSALSALIFSSQYYGAGEVTTPNAYQPAKNGNISPIIGSYNITNINSGKFVDLVNKQLLQTGSPLWATGLE